MKYCIYLITCGTAKYVGHTVNYKARMSGHYHKLQRRQHPNDRLQREFNKTKKFRSKILKQGNTLSRRKILDVEQRYIEKYANCNEGRASKYYKYDFIEFCTDVLDFVVYKWKWVFGVVLVLGLLEILR